MHVIKMHSLGNDFCMVPYESSRDYISLARSICDRRLGIGADGLIVMKLDPVEILLYARDGTRQSLNGNALRCFAWYCYQKKLTRRNKLDVLTPNGIVSLEVLEEEPFRAVITMGKPLFNNSMLSVSDVLDCFGRIIHVNGIDITVYSLFLGNIRSVIFVDNLEETTLLDLAGSISEYKLFIKKTNVDFVQVISKDRIRVKSYEAGVGFVLSSGNGCAAAVVAAQKLGFTKTRVVAEAGLGQMEVEITKKGPVKLTGPATEVFECEYREEK